MLLCPFKLLNLMAYIGNIIQKKKEKCQNEKPLTYSGSLRTTQIKSCHSRTTSLPILHQFLCDRGPLLSIFLSSTSSPHLTNSEYSLNPTVDNFFTSTWRRENIKRPGSHVHSLPAIQSLNILIIYNS